MSLTLTHNTLAYAQASLINLTLGSFMIANHAHEKWLNKFNFSLIDTNAFIKGVIALFGVILLYPSNFFEGSIIFQLGLLIAGCFLGFLYLEFENYTIKWLSKFEFFNTKSFLEQKRSNNIKNILNKKTNKINLNNKGYSYISAGFVGLFEEILFRSLLTTLCFMLPNVFWSVSSIVIINIIFALSHINIGLIHVITKFFLGIICLISYLLTGSLSLAISLHSTFNILAVKKLKDISHV